MSLLGFLVDQDYFFLAPAPARAILPLPVSWRYYLMLLGRPVPTPLRQRVLSYLAKKPAPLNLSDRQLTSLVFFLGHNSPAEDTTHLVSGILSNWFEADPQLGPRMARLAMARGQSVFLFRLGKALLAKIQALGPRGQKPATEVAELTARYIKNIHAQGMKRKDGGSGNYVMWFVLGGGPLVHAFTQLVQALDDPHTDPLPSLAADLLDVIESVDDASTGPYMKTLRQDRELLLAYVGVWRLRQVSNSSAGFSPEGFRPLM